ncbi:MAG: DUF1616 domain-containing protein [Anaerolineae bacterium]|nr:DUF1616 domain-containing protein [Anaerolineae bacterium]
MRIRNEFLPIALFGLALVGLIAAGEAGILPAALAWLRVALGLAYVLFVPGYALQAALFGRADDLDGPERLALSFGLSVAVVPPLALILDALPWGIRLWPIVVADALVIAVCSTVAWARRTRLPEAERFEPALALDLRGWWAAQDRANRLLYAGLAMAFAVAAISAAALLLLPRPGDRFTEFYILGPEGLAEGFPRRAAAGQPLTVTVGIANHEGEPAWYRVDVVNNGQAIGGSEPVLLEEQAVDERVITFVPVAVGEDVQIEFLLYRGGVPEPYRSLRLWIEVTEPVSMGTQRTGTQRITETRQRDTERSLWL